MKYRTNQERRHRKEMKAMGKWPVDHAQKDPIFKCEEVLADASLEVQNLLIGYKSNKKSYNQIRNEASIRQPYLKLSDAKKKKKSILTHRPVKETKKGVKHGKKESI
jgi:hypothetical protein